MEYIQESIIHRNLKHCTFASEEYVIQVTFDSNWIIIAEWDGKIDYH